mmetsp:Transcript_32769/g.82545  ORF Transcript_32769/g.82545 Transcript_32769/m.82545 type:complete len:773 (+) Transcript_32769:121-2439(+)
MHKLRALATLAALVSACAQEGLGWDALTTEAVSVSGAALAGAADGDSAAPTAIALHGNVLALRVLPSSQEADTNSSAVGAVHLYARRHAVAGSTTGAAPPPALAPADSHAYWEFAQQVLPPPGAQGDFASALCMGDGALLSAMTVWDSGQDQLVGAVALYRQAAGGENGPAFQLEDTLVFSELGAAPGRHMLQLSSTGDLLAVGMTGGNSAVKVFTRDAFTGWALKHTIGVDGFMLAAVTLSPSGAWLAAAGWRSDTRETPSLATVHVHQNHGLLDPTAGQPFIRTAEINITADVSKTDTVSLSMVDSLMAVGVGSRIGVYSLTMLLNWSEEDSFEFAAATASGYTLSMERHLLLVGGGTVVAAHERQWPEWPEIFQMALPGGTVPTFPAPSALVEQSELAFAILMPGIPGRLGSVTYLDASPVYPNGVNTTEAPGDKPVTVMLRMTGLDMEDLTEIRRLYLRQSIANVSLEDEGYTDMVGIEFRFFYAQVFASVAVTVPPEYDRFDVAFRLFDQIRFGALNRVLIAKDPFFATVQLSTSTATNPFLLPFPPPTPEPTPAPTYEPAPLLQTINTNSSRESNRYIETTKEAFDANPPERTSSSIITFSCIGGGAFLLLSCLLLIFRKVVMSRMLMRDVKKDKEWEYSPYENAKPKLQVFAKAQLAVAKMQEEAAYRKYYHLEDESKLALASIGKMGLAVNAFWKAAPPKDSRVTVQKATTDVIKMNRAAMAFKSAGVERAKSRVGDGSDLSLAQADHLHQAPVLTSSLEIELA